MALSIQIIIADDHEVYRDGLRSLLERVPELTVVGEASNGADLISLCKRFNPEIVFTDIKMPGVDGIEATGVIVKECPESSVIALSMFNEDHLILDMLKAGASGYLVKNAHKNEIIEAIHSVRRNIPYYCKTTSMKLARLIGQSQYGSKGADIALFSQKELEIIRLICEEKTSKEIGEMLFLSARTVEEYRQKIKDKMNVKTTTGIVIYAIKNELIRTEV